MKSDIFTCYHGFSLFSARARKKRRKQNSEQVLILNALRFRTSQKVFLNCINYTFQSNPEVTTVKEIPQVR